MDRKSLLKKAVVAGASLAAVDQLAAVAGNSPAYAAGGTLLATQYFTGAIDTQYSTSSTTLVAADTILLSVTFTAPSSGTVLVRLTGPGGIDANAQASYWGILDGTTVRAKGRGVGINVGMCGSVAFIITGLTANQSYTWDWAFAAFSSAGNAYLFHGPNYGMLVMEVWSA